MNSSPAVQKSPPGTRRLTIAGVSALDLVELRTSSPLTVQILPNGSIFAWRQGLTLIDQLLPGPAEDGLFRLLLRWHDEAGNVAGWKSLVAAGESFAPQREGSATWSTVPFTGLHCETRLELHPHLAAWTWRIFLHNVSAEALTLDVLHAQDLGIADEGAVRNNEVYTSHYIDLLPCRDEALGWVLLARQNQIQSHGRHPWAAFACVNGTTAFCTDGWQFFGSDHRLTNEPVAARSRSLPSQRLQYEFALAGLQSQPLCLTPGASGEIAFVARFIENHPAASSSADLAYLREAMPAPQSDVALRGSAGTVPASPDETSAASLFTTSPWLHGDSPTERDWVEWFQGERRHEERSSDGRILSFFHGENTHVVSREKEAAIARPHGHILRSGDSLWFDENQFGLTCYAAGIFAAQAYLGHSNFAKLLSVVRNALNVTRGSGQRVFIRRNQRWEQLGIPSVFAISPGEVRWLYRFGANVIEAVVRCAENLPASQLELRVRSGPPAAFLITHEVVIGSAELEHATTLEISAEDASVHCHPASASLIGQHQRGICFAIAATDPAQVDSIGGDGLIYPDAVDRKGPYVVLRTHVVRSCGVILLGSHEGPSALPEAIAAARRVFRSDIACATPPATPVRLTSNREPAIARINEVLPWFTHNASIHFSAPHGLEQYGGAAWGVRDVCQGSIEWLLAAGEFAVARRILVTVFEQQYSVDGNWPQWFMFPPYRFIQQAHSHGDVCFWPVKAVCDYIEASNDLTFLQTKIGYTDPQTFELSGPEETVLAHCERVVRQCEARFIPGTALVNYGDGDWDDTLQPADPTMRTHMTSAWTVALAFHTFRQLAEVCRRSGHDGLVASLDDLLSRVRRDFAAHLMPDGIVAGFLISEPGKPRRPLLHPQDEVTRIRYRLLPMTRSILAELFTAEEAKRHLELMERELLYPDGVRLMSEPSSYAGGIEQIFKRGETCANVGREIGLQYVHAHLRYAEALAKIGKADALLTALQVVNPVALREIVPHAAPRQSNVYFSSSDADFPDRYEAKKRWAELRTGKVAVRGGWRLYSSGPGLFIHAVRACLLGVRERFDDIVFDPVLPYQLDGLRAETKLCGHRVELCFHVRENTFAPRSISVNGIRCSARRESNPYRIGGLVVTRADIEHACKNQGTVIEIDL